MTKYELGFWLLFLILYLLKNEMNTMGNKKNVFDFMTPSYK